jgi:hypothetical protein
MVNFMNLLCVPIWAVLDRQAALPRSVVPRWAGGRAGQVVDTTTGWWPRASKLVVILLVRSLFHYGPKAVTGSFSHPERVRPTNSWLVGPCLTVQ